MPYDMNSNPIWAECPDCGKRAEGNADIDDKFGFRDMGDGRVIPQSWCKDCR